METIKEAIQNLIIDYTTKGYTRKAILKEIYGVIYWELRDGGFI